LIAFFLHCNKVDARNHYQNLTISGRMIMIDNPLAKKLRIQPGMRVAYAGVV
jgi:hypothetical protein